MSYSTLLHQLHYARRLVVEIKLNELSGEGGGTPALPLFELHLSFLLHHVGLKFINGYNKIVATASTTPTRLTALSYFESYDELSPK